VKTIDRRGKERWVERPFKTLLDAQRRPHGTPRPSGTPRGSEKIKLGVPLVQLVRSLVVLMTIISAMVLLGKLR